MSVFVNPEVPRYNGAIAGRLCFNGGLGDKIYSLPSLYVYEGTVGIRQGDEPIYRLVNDKVRAIEPGDSEAFVSIGRNSAELIDQIAERVGVRARLGLKLPILETTQEEKEAHLDGGEYVVLALWGSDKPRCWSEGLVLRDMFDCETKIVFFRGVDLFPVVERAKCVISVNTSLIPIAGALQVPLITIDAPNRAGYFLDVQEAIRNERSVLEAYQRLFSKPRLRCWCGETGARRSVKNNIYVLTCDRCGTERQDIKLSEEGITRFYKEHYHRGWRKVVEGLIGYERRCLSDLELAKTRLAQWGTIEGKTWLDVGCGNGSLIEILREKGWAADGLDIDPMPAVSQGLLPMTSWDEAGRYDVISYVDCLEHSFVYDELPRAIDHLAEGGKIVVEFPVAQEEAKHYRRLQHIWFWTEETFEAMVKHYGLKVHVIVKPLSGKRAAIIGR